jgi:RNA polymerase sigma factor (sigma-70 family)
VLTAERGPGWVKVKPSLRGKIRFSDRDGESERWCTAEAPFGVIWQPRTRAKGEAHARTSRQLSGNGFVSFFHERYSRTVVLLIAMGASRADAEDAAQEAMVLAWRQWESIREPDAWVRTVAVRAYLKQARAQRSQAAPLDESAREPAADPDLGVFAEQQQHVLSLLRGLPAGQRTIAALFYDGLTCEEIGELVGKPPATVRSQLRHARNSLKGLMSSGGI